ncbi:aldehyde ferredoxin oxidoreductase, partial [Candidatus Bathyarchaeota archaeon]|nr:aldehyde ferredoxin oxidoreductase [Candidatus Bathyarchaeota archaeon]
MNYGYMGTILRVDLSNEKISFEHPEEAFYRQYFGGRGIITYFLLKELEPRINPLASENKLIFASGPVTGAPISGSGRNSVGAKSPLTGAYGEAEAGGFWGVELKLAGFDAIIFEGKAVQPVYLWIHDEKVEIMDASHLWGMEIKPSQETIRKDLKDTSVKMAQIGPGGEKMVRYASIVNDMKHVAGRCGMGAVMGSKNLKAIVVHKGKTLTPVDVASFKGITDMEKFKAFESGFGKYGTAIAVNSMMRAGFLPTKNWQEGIIENGNDISGITLANSEILKGRDSCFGCSIRCKRVVEIPGKVDPKYGGPEYETIGAFGSSCGNTDMETVCIANQLCNMYGMDTISAGMTIAFAMECFE